MAKNSKRKNYYSEKKIGEKGEVSFDPTIANKLIKNFYVHSYLDNFKKVLKEQSYHTKLTDDILNNYLTKEIKRSQKLEKYYLNSLQKIYPLAPELKSLKNIAGMNLSTLQDKIGVVPIHFTENTNFEALFDKVIEDLQLNNGGTATIQQVQDTFSLELQKSFNNLSKTTLGRDLDNILSAFAGQQNIYSQYSKSIDDVTKLFEKGKNGKFSPYTILDKKLFAKTINEFSAFLDTAIMGITSDEIVKYAAESISKIDSKTQKIESHSGRQNKADFAAQLKNGINIGFSVKSYRPDADSIHLHSGGALFNELEDGFLSQANQLLSLDKILSFKKKDSSFNAYIRYYLANYLALTKSGYILKNNRHKVNKLSEKQYFIFIEKYITYLVSYWIGAQVIKELNNAKLENSQVAFFVSNGKIVPVSEVLLEIQRNFKKNNLLSVSFTNVPVYGPTVLYRKKISSLRDKKDGETKAYYPASILSVGSWMGQEILKETKLSIKIKLSAKLQQLMK